MEDKYKHPADRCQDYYDLLAMNLIQLKTHDDLLYWARRFKIDSDLLKRFEAEKLRYQAPVWIEITTEVANRLADKKEEVASVLDLERDSK